LLKQEKAVRDWKNAAGVDNKHFLREVRELVRAIQERDARIVEEAIADDCGCRTCEVLSDVAEEIRRKR